MNPKNNKFDPVYIVAGSRPWSRKIYDEVISGYPGSWTFVDSPEDLNRDFLQKLNPRYLFFFHWSWKVEPEIFDRWECIGFHMTDLPYGRGGSPVQNLILRGHKDTKLSAIRLVEKIDAGPIYMKEDLSLEGRAEEIYLRVSYLAANMVYRIINEQPEPIPQAGVPTIFMRRRPEESGIPKLKSLDALYDFIRMLDAEGYPHAFIEDGTFRFQFRKVELCRDTIVGEVEISLVKRDFI